MSNDKGQQEARSFCLLTKFSTKISDFFWAKVFWQKMHFLPKNFAMKKTSAIFVESFVNKQKKKKFLAAFYHLTYQHDSKDFNNICNYKTYCWK